MANTENLKPDRVPGDIVSADQHNILADAAKRTVTGPNVVETPGGWHISDKPGMADRPVVLVKKPGDTDKNLIVRQISYVGRKADEGVYEWASTPFEGVPEFGAAVSDYEQFHWAPPDPLPAGVTDPIPDIDASFLYARFIRGRWLVLRPASGVDVAWFTFTGEVANRRAEAILCTPIEGGPDIPIALPYDLRLPSWSGKRISGFIKTVSSNDVWQRRTSWPNVGAADRNVEVIVREYVEGDKVFAVRAPTLIVGVDWQELEAGRAWARANDE